MKFEEMIPLLKAGKKMRLNHWDLNCYICLKNNHIKDEENCWRQFMDSEILSDDWQEYKESLLTDKEKQYLESLIEPFVNDVVYIVLNEYKDISFLKIYISTDESIILPNFKKGTYYKKLKPGKYYSLKELNL